jgi:hypothetical protein
MKRLMLVVAAASIGTTVALAESEEGRQACMQDAFKFCSDAIPDRERVFQCLASHQDVISATCHENMAPSLAAERAAKEQRAPETKGAAAKPKAARHAAAERPVSTKRPAATRSAAGKAATPKHAALPAGRSPLKTHARETNHAHSKAASTRHSPTTIARRDGKPLNLLPR